MYILIADYNKKIDVGDLHQLSKSILIFIRIDP
jgi:hypothetical protein